LFYNETGNLRPPNVDLNELSDNSVRQVLETEVFPNKETPNGIPTNIPVFNLSYFPSERGPYNFDVDATAFSAGINEDGSLANPESRWGGVMRKIESTNFDATNVEYIEFWMMDPFTGDQTNAGELYFNLGDISEDILRDSRKSYENGLPTSAEVTDVDTTVWGRVPTLQALVDNFSNEADARQYQDVGYDGLMDDDERSFFNQEYLEKIANRYGNTSTAYLQAVQDPGADNYHYFRGTDYDNDPTYSSILNRYKQYNGPDGNSPTDAQNQETYPTAATTMPNVEDINRDNTLSETERYFQYKIELDPNKMNVGDGYITDDYHAVGIRLPNGTVGDVHWYQFKIPIRDPEKIIGGIQDFQSIRFLRMFMKGFERPMVLRFATLELVRGEWRRYRYDLLSPGEYIPNDIQSETQFDIAAVNIEENGRRDPIPYVVPPGIEREINLGTTNLQQLNEQSMVLRVTNLIDGDARGAYKTTDFDFREYGKLQMFVHAEWMEQLNSNKDGDLTVFVRIGADLTENYYEYEIPLTFTPWYTSPGDPEAIWPASNSFDIDLQRLVNFKLQRNVALRTPGSGVFLNKPYFAYDGENKVTVLGSPTISDVKSIMIGVRNPKKTSFNTNDDGESKSAEIWVNELRLTDFNKQGGIAATARIKSDLADLGNISLSGLYSTPGYGSLEKKTSERSQEYIRNWDFSTNLQLGKFFPERFGIRIPMHFDYSQAKISPKYNQLDPDIILIEDLKTYNKYDQDSIKSLNEDFVMRKNLNFINVRKDRVGASSKSNFWDIENFDATYSYSEIFTRNVDIEYHSEKTYRGGLGYNFNSNPKNYKPFSKMKAFRGKAFALIKDINFTLLPKLFSFRTDMNREYSKRLLRNKSQYDVIIEPTYLKKWDWNRNYDLKWDLASSLRLDYKVDVKAYIDELPGSIEKDDPLYDEKKERVKSQLGQLGSKNLYVHNFSVNYTIPINKFPLLDWLNATARYQTNYKWQASPVSLQLRLGNQIENSNIIQLNGNASLDRLYDKVPFLKKAKESGRNKGRQAGPRTPPQRKPDPAADTTQTKPKKNYFKIVGNGFLKILMGVKRVSLSYNQGNGTYLPGFRPEPGIIGNNWGADAPGLGFVFGSQKDIRGKAVQNEWISTDTLLNTAYVNKFNEQINFRATVEPFRDFKIEITADRSFSLVHQEYFKADANGDFFKFSPTEQGNFSMSFFAWRTAWVKDDDQNINGNFQTLKDNRQVVAFRLAEENPNWSGIVVDSTGYPEGYGPTQQDVLLYSFMSAYSGKDIATYALEAMPNVPHLNWRVTYNGLSKIDFLKKYLRNVTLTHGYRSTYSIGSFQQNALFDGDGSFPSSVDASNNFISQYQINQVSIVEQFSPLITFDMTWVNSLMTKFEIKKTRNLSMSFVNNQLTEVTSEEYVVGLGYRFKDVKFAIRSMGGSGARQNIKSDLNLRADFSIRSNKTVLRRIDEDINQISSGQKVISINTSADYMMSQRLNIRLFFDKVINNPYVSSQFRNSTTNGGISLRFTLAQ
jgi:cell surface protein SprA